MGQLVRFTPLATTRELLQLYNVKALKHLSQNFLLDPRATMKIAKAAGDLTDSEVCEIGPGPGGITRSLLLTHAKKVVVIEKDKRFQPILEALQHTVRNRLDVMYADILDFDLSKVFDSSLKKEWEDEQPKIHIIGNLPFNIADPLLIRYLKDISLRRNAWSYGRVGLTLVFQDEVARRITSPILSKHRCRLSVMCQNWCKVTYKYKINGHAFVPKPEVNAGVVHLEPLIKPKINLDFNLVERFVRTIFNCRQKYIRNTVKNFFPESLRSGLLDEFFRLADVDDNIRPYEISSMEMLRMISAYKEICDSDPRLYNYNFRDPKLTRETGWMNNTEYKDQHEVEQEAEKEVEKL